MFLIKRTSAVSIVHNACLNKSWNWRAVSTRRHIMCFRIYSVLSPRGYIHRQAKQCYREKIMLWNEKKVVTLQIKTLNS